MLATTHETLPRPLAGDYPTRPLGSALPRVLHELDGLVDLPAPIAATEGAQVLARLLENPAFMLDQVLPCLDSTAIGGPYVAQRYQGRATGYSLEIFVWPPGAETAIHDHSCWGMIGAAFGTLHEERYVRLDDAAHENQAHLRSLWRRTWRPQDGISTLLPYEGGVHRVSNPSTRTVLSVHVYGPAGPIDGRDYNPLRDYVCDRLVDENVVRRILNSDEVE